MSFSSDSFSAVPFSGKAPASGAESWSVAPSSGHTIGAGQVLTATGIGTFWSGSPFSITGGTGSATITAQSTSSLTAGSITLNITVRGTIILSDGVTTATYDGSAVAPLVPTIGVATNNHNSTASIAFTPNADNGGATVTLATATGSLGDSGTSAGTSPITATVASGNLGLSQTWTVTTTNSVGPSTPSGASNSISVDGLPGTPTIGVATAGNASASVAFTPGITGGLPVTYVASSTPGGFTGSGSTSPISVPGLSNGTAYTFKVHAVNSNGSSADSAASNSVTPQNQVTMVRDAPFFSGDLLGTVAAQTLTLSAATVGTGRTATYGGAIFAGDATDVGKWIFEAGATGRAVVTGFTSTTVATIEITEAFVGTSIASSGSRVGPLTYQPSKVVAGVLTAIGSPQVSGYASAKPTIFCPVPNVTWPGGGAFWIIDTETPTGSFGDFAGIATFPNINGTVVRAIPLNAPPTQTPTTLVYCELCPEQASDQIGTVIAQTLGLSAASVGTGRTATAGAATFAGNSTDVGKYIFETGAGMGRAIITAPGSTTVCTVTIIDAFAGTSILANGWSFGAPQYADFTYSGRSMTIGAYSKASIIAIPLVRNAFLRVHGDTPDASNGIQLPTAWNGLG